MPTTDTLLTIAYASIPAFFFGSFARMFIHFVLNNGENIPFSKSLGIAIPTSVAFFLACLLFEYNGWLYLVVLIVVGGLGWFMTIIDIFSPDKRTYRPLGVTLGVMLSVFYVVVVWLVELFAQ